MPSGYPAEYISRPFFALVYSEEASSLRGFLKPPNFGTDTVLENVALEKLLWCYGKSNTFGIFILSTVIFVLFIFIL